MRCPYCGQENPDGAVFCQCGRPLSLSGGFGNSNQTGGQMGGQMGAPMGGQMGGQMNPFPRQTLDQVKHKKAFNPTPIIVILALLLGAGIFFGVQWYNKKSVTDESTWKSYSGEGYSMKAPRNLKKGKMLTPLNDDEELLNFYTSEDIGFDVSVYHYTNSEKTELGSLSAKEYLALVTHGGRRTTKIDGQEINYQVREGKEYIYAGYNRHAANHVSKSDDVYYVEALFPRGDCYYQVNVYCTKSEKSKYEEYLLKMLDSFNA